MVQGGGAPPHAGMKIKATPCPPPVPLSKKDCHNLSKH